MKILIDGYNLLHQTPMLTRDRGQGWLQRARQRLIAFLASSIPAETEGQVVVVFDAHDPSSGPNDSHPHATDHGHIRILFARGHAEADDLLEELIELCPHPSSLTLVSSDRRVQAAGRRRKVKEIVESRAWFEWLDSLPEITEAFTLDGFSEEESRTSPPNSVEVDFWLREFGLLPSHPMSEEPPASPVRQNNPATTQHRSSTSQVGPKPSNSATPRRITRPTKASMAPPPLPTHKRLHDPIQARKRAGRRLNDLDNPFSEEDLRELP